MKLILVRHGQTPSNVDHIIDTVVPGPPLTELGREQADAVPSALADVAIDAIYVSTQLRAQQTAAPLAASRGLEPRIRDGLREITAGEFEGRSDKDAIKGYVSTEFAWVEGDLERRMPGGQSGAETLDRFDAVVREAFDAGLDSVVFVSHGSMLRTWSGIRADNVDVEYVRRNPLRNTGVIVLEGSPGGGWTALSWLDESLGGPALDDPQEAGVQVPAN